MAQKALRKIAQESKVTNPEAAEVLTKNVYMDDICDSVDTNETAQRLSENVDFVLAKGRFKVKGWTSNKDLTRDVKEVSEVTKVIQGEEKKDKVLGVVWKYGRDEFRFKIKSTCSSIKQRPRLGWPRGRYWVSGLVSTILSVWPLHLLSEKIEIDLQHLWQLGIAWDEELSTKVREKLIKSFHEVTELNQVSFPRHLCAKEQASFCVFSDNQVSFQDAYVLGASIIVRLFWRVPRDLWGLCIHSAKGKEWQVVEVDLITAKSRVTPLEQLTIPRLALQTGMEYLPPVWRRLSKRSLEFSSEMFCSSQTAQLC